MLNNSRVLPARLRGIKAATGGQIEMLLVEENGVNDWWVMLRPGKRVRAGTQIHFLDPEEKITGIGAMVCEKNSEGHCRLIFSGTSNVLAALNFLGETPLPPYITRSTPAQLAADRERYQTVYAQPAGSVAAPTAGLHYSDPLMAQIRARGVQICFVTLHVGLATFAPVKTETVADHIMHEERFELGTTTAQCVNEAKRSGRRVIAVGTTTVRVLESVAADNEGKLVATTGRTGIFIYPAYTFKVVDALQTNFHLSQSTLLMLVCAFAAPGETRGRELVLSTYAEAIRQRYRFYSYGDAMLIL